MSCKVRSQVQILVNMRPLRRPREDRVKPDPKSSSTLKKKREREGRRGKRRWEKKEERKKKRESERKARNTGLYPSSTHSIHKHDS